MRPRTAILLGTLAGALALFAWSRTRSGGAGLASTLEFLDVSASRVGAAVNSRGYRNNNPGNIRFIATNPFNGQVGNDGGLGVYARPQDGVRALGKQLQAYERRHLVTVRDIVATWAPPNENDTSAYVADVAAQLDVDADAVINVTAQLANLARAIAKHENGYLDSAYDWTWVYLP